ncbi:MAG: YfiR family protein [Massilia sp.]|nr:YfiR family protein [Massilia sp.]
MVRVLSLLVFLSGLGLAGSVCLAQVDGMDMKAAYIFNFAMFTTWPDGGARGPLVVCAHPDGPLWPSLQALNGRPVNGRPWSVTDLAHPKAAHCDIVVLARTAPQPALPAAGVLVVRDGVVRDRGGHGAAITLVEDDEHIRFDIDTQEAARCGLRFSSRLLRLARNVL